MKTPKYTKANYSVEIELLKSTNEVFNHVIDLSKWWPEEFVGESMKSDTEFVLKTGEGHYSKNKVVEFIPNKKFAWLTIESLRKTDNYAWAGAGFIFELISIGDNTLLKFTYDGVVLENETQRLAQICDICIKEMLYNFIINRKAKEILNKK
jgi:hypothetical protein